MGNIKYIIGALVVGYLVMSMFSGGSRGGIDLAQVLDRTDVALKSFQSNLNDKKITKLDEKTLEPLTGLMQHAMNMEPAIHKTPIGIELVKGATFQGFDDKNMDNIQDYGEADLFKVEMDFDGERLIASIGGKQSTSSGMARGLITGMVLGHLMGRQRSAGVRSGHFANRKVQSKSAYTRSGGPTRTGSSARSGARSGGRFGGK